uniref:Uncharacterized protein n=1 Tax=Nitratidesulfovibrio vulgaris (strain DSM 19637 / Miyazaki F) TaxID=883 RepID=B8DPI3_NITV9
MTNEEYPYDLMQVVLVTRDGKRLEIEARVGALLFVDVECENCCVSCDAQSWDDVPGMRRRAVRRVMDALHETVPLLAGP